MHATSGGRKGKNQLIGTFLLESKKQPLARKRANKSKTMHVQDDTLSALI